jgi:hypothetical protein
VGLVEFPGRGKVNHDMLYHPNDLTITVTLPHHHETNAVRSTASLRLLALLVRSSSTCSSYGGHVQMFGWGNQGM